MKKHLINFLLWFYVEYIKENWEELKPFARLIMYPFWFIRSIVLWILLPIFIFEYMLINSSLYKEVEKMNQLFLNQLNN